VNDVAKGKGSGNVVINQPGGLYPTSDWKGVVVGYAVGNPLLLPGEQALLFRNPSGKGTFYSVQPVTGIYLIEGGELVAMPSNPFATQIAGLSPSSLLGQVSALSAG
jgi:hypothetical protein